MVCSAVSAPARPPNLSSRPWFQRALVTRAFAAGEFQIGLLTRRPVLVFAYPVVEQDRVQGVVFAAMAVEKFAKLAEEISPPAGGVVLVLNGEGRLLALVAWAGGAALVLRLVRALAQAAEQLAAGDLTARAALPYRAGELGELAPLFDDMATHIERRAAERAARPARASAELERIFTPSSDLICVADAGGYFRRVNPAWTRVLGWSAEELVAQPSLEFLHPDDRAATAEEARRLADGAETINFENRYRARDGSYRWLEWCASPAHDGRTIYAVARDITERKRAEAELRALNARAGATHGRKLGGRALAERLAEVRPGLRTIYLRVR